jgi:hypothetical protein
MTRTKRDARPSVLSLATLAALSACSTPSLPSPDAGGDVSSPMDARGPEGDATPEAATPDVRADGGPMDAQTGDAGTRDASAGGSTDAGPDVEEDAGPETGRTLVYVLDRLTIERAGAGSLAGFNLDGIFSNPDGSTPRSCMRGDVFSTLDPDQNHPIAMLDPSTGRPSAGPSMCAMGAGCRGGVDNVLPEIADFVMTSGGMDLRANAQQLVSSGELAFVLRVSGVDDLRDDPSVTLRVYQAFPTFSTGCSSVTPGREYAIARSSLVPGATSIEQARFTVRASLAGGRLLPRGGSSLPLPVAPGITVDVQGTLLRANLSETALTAGNLGGYARGSQFYDAVVMMNPTLAPLASIAIGQFVDLEEPLPAPGSAPGLCARTSTRPPMFGNIGIGASFGAVSATLAAAPVDERPAGACGG